MTSGSWGGDVGSQIPGDPDQVLAAVREFSATATSLGEAADNLRRLESPDTCSEAVSAWLVKARTAAAQLELVKVRYEVTAAALRDYEPHLRQAQENAQAAVGDAEAARAEGNRAAAAANQAREAMMWSTDETQRGDYLVEYRRELARRDQAAADVSAARWRLQQAIDARDDAANRAADRIEGVVRDSSLNDTFADKFREVADGVTNWLDETRILERISDVLDVVSTVLFVAGAVIAFVPIPGIAQGVGATLMTASKITGAIALGAELLDGVVKGYRSGDWSSLGVTVAATVAAKAASKFLGPVVGKKLQQGVVKYNSTLRSRMARETGEVVRSATRTSSARSIPGSPISAVRQASTQVPRSLSASPADTLRDFRPHVDMGNGLRRLQLRDVTVKQAVEVAEGSVEEVADAVLESRAGHRVVRQAVGAAR